MKGKVLITEQVSQKGIDFLIDKGYEIVFPKGKDEDSLIEAAKDCEAILVRILPISKKLIDSCPNLKVVAKHGVGVDNIDLEACRAKGIKVVNTPGANSRSVAEYTMALILSCAKQIPKMASAYKNGNLKAKDSTSFVEISGKTLGVLGLGKIGREVANMASKGFGMKVLVYDPFIKSLDLDFTLVEDKDEIFKEADYISIHSPLTEDTRHSVGKRELDLMKETAYLVNCSRGPIINEDELIEALKNKKIAGAGLDVTEKEPLDPSSELFKLENVIVTNHIAATTKEAMDEMVLRAARGLDDVLESREPEYLIK